MAATTTTNTECARIADQLRSVLDGEAWHGPSLRELLSEITPEQANAHPLAGGHSIWELVLHIEVWTRFALEAMQGTPIPAFVENMPPEQNWPLISDSSAAGWKAATEKLLRAGEELASAVEKFGDERLAGTVPGRSYAFERLLRGSVQHCVYHSGQIALLKKGLQRPA
ncbi:MAG: DinB family protein [Actinomycetota bacterium]